MSMPIRSYWNHRSRTCTQAVLWRTSQALVERQDLVAVRAAMLHVFTRIHPEWCDTARPTPAEDTWESAVSSLVLTILRLEIYKYSCGVLHIVSYWKLYKIFILSDSIGRTQEVQFYPTRARQPHASQAMSPE